jgi:ABC-type oligopeptide transport system substrate-binding subunit
MRLRVWFAMAGVVIGAGLLAVGGFGGPVHKRGGTLRISGGRDLDSVDPALGYNTSSWTIEFATCAKLYNYPDKPAPAGAIAVPELAKGFPTVSKHGKVQTIRLKHTFRFNTGKPVTAVNFVAAFNRDANPKLQSPAVNYLHEIVGADAVINGRAQTISGVRARGRYTLQIRTTQPLPDLAARLTMPFFCPIAVNTPLKEIDNPLGSGPYYIASRVPNRKTVLKRNRFYRGSRPANVDQMIYTINGDEACRVAVEQNAMDYCFTIPPADYPALAARYGINRKGGRFFAHPTLGFDYFAFNHDRPAFNGRGQIPLKQAINWAIDRRALVRAAGSLSGQRTDQILPPALARNASIYALGGVNARSLAKARVLLKRAKIKPKTLVLYTDNFGYGPSWAQIFQLNLRRLGIEVVIKVFPRSTYFRLTGTRGAPFDVAVGGGWILDYADAVAIFGPMLDGHNLTGSGNTNIAYFDRPKYNREIERIARLSGKARRKAWADLDVKMMRDDPPWAPVVDLTAKDFISKTFGCYNFQPVIATPDLAAACKK